MEKFDPNPAIDLWLSSKPRRLSQKTRKPYKPRSSASEQSTSQSSETTTDTDESDTGDTLADRDNLIQVSDKVTNSHSGQVVLHSSVYVVINQLKSFLHAHIVKNELH